MYKMNKIGSPISCCEIVKKFIKLSSNQNRRVRDEIQVLYYLGEIIKINIDMQ